MAKKGKEKPVKNSQAVVADVQEPLFKRVFNKTTVVIIVLVVALGLLAFGGQYLYSHLNSKTKTTTKTVCSNDLLKQAADNMVPGKLSNLEPIVKKIIATKNYDKDPNCLMVVTNYYVMIQDPTTADTYYKKLTTVYTADTKISPVIAGKARGLGYLRQEIDNLKQQQQLRDSGKIKGSGWNAR